MDPDRHPPDVPAVPVRLHKGRGAVSNLAHRFMREQRSAFDDGWESAEVQATEGDDEVLAPATEIILEDCKSAISANDSLDIPFDYSVNPYRGCEHGCIYCFARPTHSYLGYSPGLDFETKIIAKRNIAAELARELAAPRYRPSIINIGSATDCYQPVERELKLTRGVIEVLAEAGHPFSLITKSSGVERDLDRIAPLAARGLAAVYVTITTLDARLVRKLEPRAAAPQRRLRVIRTLAEAGVPVGVSVAPQIPFVTEDMEQVLAAAREAGASRAFYTVLRLPWELGPIFQEWLQAHFPDRAHRVMARVRDMRGGKDYDASWGQRMHGSGIWAQLLDQRFNRACARLGYELERTPLDLSQFRPRSQAGQGSLF
ncbi:MAG: PA0069 family radical SAM protein [Ottowia sp.]|uniref:PA0069 family radical SAM protein n=1 Tax=unclassified Ottowia TaxID=2645081 RepID=UPI003C2AF514